MFRIPRLAGCSPIGLLALWFVSASLPAGDRLVVGNTHTLLTGLVYIAGEQGLYADQGLDVEVVSLSTGGDGLAGIRDGSFDLYNASDVTFVKHFHRNPGLRVISTLGEWNNETKILARGDRGIRQPKDLEGKRIAVHRGLAMHWFLDRFLARNGLGEADIQPVFMHLAKQPDALVAGEVDAFVSRDPFLAAAIERLGDNRVLLEAPGLMIKRFVLIAGERLAGDRGDDRLARFLTALVRAEQLVRRDPGKAESILSAKLGLDRETVRSRLKVMRLNLNLDDHLLYTLEQVARWWQAIEGYQAPWDINFLDTIVTHHLRVAKPYGVLLHQ